MLLPVGRSVDLLTLGHPSQFGHLPAWKEAVAALHKNLGASYLTPPPVGFIPPAKEPLARLEVVPRKTARRSAAILAGRRFMATDQPPASFRYSPIHDFWRELTKLGPATVDELFDHLGRICWARPSGKPLTSAIVRTDLVSMVKHGFAKVVE